MKNLFYLLSALLAFVFVSCDRNDDVSEPDNYFSTTNYYGEGVTAEKVRNDAVGNWYKVGDNSKVLLEVIKWEKNPNYPSKDPSKWEAEYIYTVKSNIERYEMANSTVLGEASIYKNNINMSGYWHLIVEGNTGYIFPITNNKEKIKVEKR